MNCAAISDRPTTRRPATVGLASCTVLLGATMLCPPLVAHLQGLNPSDLPSAATSAFLSDWKPNAPGLNAPLRELVEYWRLFHLVKAGFALLLVVVAAPTTAWWYRNLWVAPTRRRATLALAAALFAGIFTAGGVVLLVANIQGAIAPLASLISLMPWQKDVALARIAERISAALSAEQAPEGVPEPVSLLVADFATYHVAMAAMAGLIAIVLLAGGIAAARSAHVTSRSVRVTVATLALMCSAATLVVCAANISSATNAEQALRLFFTG